MIHEAVAVSSFHGLGNAVLSEDQAPWVPFQVLFCPCTAHRSDRGHVWPWRGGGEDAIDAGTGGAPSGEVGGRGGGGGDSSTVLSVQLWVAKLLWVAGPPAPAAVPAALLSLMA